MFPSLVTLRNVRRTNVSRNSTGSSANSHTTMVVRRSGNYQPSFWDDNFLQSLNSDYKSNACKNQLQKLKEDARSLLKEAANTSAQLELIDEFQRLGIGYHFELEIKEIHNTISTSIRNDGLGFEDDLYITALCFRLLRQNSYKVSQDVFKVVHG